MQGFVLQEVSESAHKAVQSSQLLNRLEDQIPNVVPLIRPLNSVL